LAKIVALLLALRNSKTKLTHILFELTTTPHVTHG